MILIAMYPIASIAAIAAFCLLGAFVAWRQSKDKGIYHISGNGKQTRLN